MVEAASRMVDPNLSYRSVREPREVHPRRALSALYEQGCVSQVGIFSRLEDQMGAARSLPTSIARAKLSLDRFDAMVWAFTELGRRRRAGVGRPLRPAALRTMR
jgi:phage terminase large subunit-like protein